MKRIFFERSIVILLTLSLFACQPDPGDSISDPGAEDDDPIIQTDAAATNLTFTLPRSVIELGTNDGADTINVLDLTGQNDSVTLPAYEGLNTLTLPKTGVYILTLLDQPDVSPGARSISSAISTIGSFKIASAGLSSLPLKEGSGNEIDLGEIQGTPGEIGSSISQSDVETLSGFDSEEIAIIGEYDIKNNLVRNPDIDGDNRIDWEEDPPLEWKIYMRNVFFLGFDDFDFESGSFAGGTYSSAANFLPKDVWLEVEMSNSGIVADNTVKPPVTLFLPQELMVTKNGSPVSYLTTESDGSQDGSTWRENYFAASFILDNGTPPSGDVYASSPPYNGSYALAAGDSGSQEAEFLFSDLRFNDSTIAFDGLLFPIFTIDRDSEGTYTTLRARWIRIDGDSFVPVDRSIVQSSRMIVSAQLYLASTQSIDRLEYLESIEVSNTYPPSGVYPLISDNGNETLRVALTWMDLLREESVDISAYGFTDDNIIEHGPTTIDVNGNWTQYHYYTPGDIFLP